MIPTRLNLGMRSHAPYPPPIDMAPVDAYRVHLHLWAYYQQTGEAVLPLSDLRNWPKGIDISRKRFQTALGLLCTSQHIRIEKVGKVSYAHLFPHHASLPTSPSF